ncbi:MAG: diacylglycerol kinase [Pseudomonadales bacterium]|nr:diacylglycerol kinase [Pseudomonadales bacterium]MCP5356894.1 diacylglycerol kinase [Pseudomonadales bacterium]
MSDSPERSAQAGSGHSPEVPPKRKGVSRLIAAAGYSFAGLRAAFASEEAFRMEVVVLVLFTPVAFLLGETGVERALLIGVLVLLMIIELLNTAVEAVVDRIGSDYHELSKQAKDIGSAAVFLGMVLVALVWGLILL